MNSQAAYRALGDEHRRHILRFLHEGPRRAGDIAGDLPLTWPAVSRHLALLREAGLVSSTRERRELVYALQAEPLRALSEELASLAAIPSLDNRADESREVSAATGSSEPNPAPEQDLRHRLDEILDELRTLQDQVDRLRGW